MPIGLHLFLSILSQAVGALGCAFLVMTHTKQIEAMGINDTFAFFGSFILGSVIPRLLFKYLIPASCPECGDRAIFRGGRPITYHCKACGHVHRTSISEGNSRHH